MVIVTWKKWHIHLSHGNATPAAFSPPQQSRFGLLVGHVGLTGFLAGLLIPFLLLASSTIGPATAKAAKRLTPRVEKCMLVV